MNMEYAVYTSQAGTGFMLSLTDAVKHFEAKGYDKNLTQKFDHFECDDGQVKLYPADFIVDDVFRYENTSDPDDQAILFAISSVTYKIKGIYIDSFGLYHNDLSAKLNAALKFHGIKH